MFSVFLSAYNTSLLYINTVCITACVKIDELDVNLDQSRSDFIDRLDSIDSCDVDSAALSPDVHFFVMLRYALLAVQLLPGNSISGACHFMMKHLYYFTIWLKHNQHNITFLSNAI